MALIIRLEMGMGKHVVYLPLMLIKIYQCFLVLFAAGQFLRPPGDSKDTGGSLRMLRIQAAETPIICYYDVLASKYAGGAGILKEVYRLNDQG